VRVKRTDAIILIYCNAFPWKYIGLPRLDATLLLLLKPKSNTSCYNIILNYVVLHCIIELHSQLKNVGKWVPL
jgi:hypothetical protein